eukprot:267230_1
MAVQQNKHSYHCPTMFLGPCESLHSPEFSFVTVNHQQQASQIRLPHHHLYTTKNGKYDILNDLNVIDNGIWTPVHGIDGIGNTNTWYLYYWYLLL